MASKSKATKSKASKSAAKKAAAGESKAVEPAAAKSAAKSKAEQAAGKPAAVEAPAVTAQAGGTEMSAADKFLQAFGPGESYRPFTEADDARLGESIPEVMRAILRREGWCSYKEQVLWLCDPDDWRPAARAWFPGDAGARVVARTGFGDLCVWDGAIFWFVMVHESLVMESVDDADWFFSQVLPADDFAPQTYLPGRVRAARGQAGPLEWDETYAYAPALALGGSVKTSRIERVKAAEALVMLAGLAPIRRL